MNNISRKQYEAAYHAGLKFHNGTLKRSEIRKELAGTGLTATSASILATNVSYLLKGKCYKRGLSEAATDDYLAWIRRDRGHAALRIALDALRQHIEYFEKQRNVRRPGLRALLAKYRELIQLPTESLIQLIWDEGPFANFTDELPLEWFAEEGISRRKQHFVSGRRGGPWSAFCDVSVRGLVADLDYSPYPEENQEDGMLLGVTRLHFEDEDRSSIFKVEWKQHGSEVFIRTRFKRPRFVVPPETDYVPPTEAGEKSARQVRDRPGQASFRRKLKSVYGNCCCVSGCSVPEALEGAHIDPYTAPASDNIRNGLLLRSDLHTLFDRHLIAINPDTMQIHVSPRARGTAGYEQWHGETIRVPAEPTHRPDQCALRRHWQKKLH